MSELLKIPGVGKSIEKDLIMLGYKAISDLRGAVPQKMYDEICEITNSKQDRCLLYVFRCAVYYAGNAVHDQELLKWWNWKD